MNNGARKAGSDGPAMFRFRNGMIRWKGGVDHGIVCRYYY